MLDKILSGDVLTDGENCLWNSSLASNGSVYRQVKAIEEDLAVIIVRDRSRRQLRFHGPAEKRPVATRLIGAILTEAPSANYEIQLSANQFSQMVQGGFKTVEEAVGENVARFDVVSKKIVVTGTQEQYEMALAVLAGKKPIALTALLKSLSDSNVSCPICFCEPETPVQASCKHVYCQNCFEEYCKSAASTCTHSFHIKCQGDEGKCSRVFELKEVKDHVSSSVLEDVLQSSFEEFVQRHPEQIRYCPTPNCGYVYRYTPTKRTKLPAYTCPNCFEPICTSCNARHGDYTCAEYKDISSGGYEALQRLKKELNIKDCPKCKTPMEKTEGCNHMTCGTCKAHICWVCLAVFKESGPCYAHMTKEHGGIGLDYLGDLIH